MRTAIHRPSAPEFNPANYSCHGVFDYHPEDGTAHIRRQVVGELVDAGYSFSSTPHPSGQCGHCGAYLRYAALMVHEPTKTLMDVGETCLSERFLLATKADFAALRAAATAQAEVTRARNRRHELAIEVIEWMAGLAESNPGAADLLAEITYRGNGGLADDDSYAGSVLSDMGRKMNEYGPLTERQSMFACKLVTEHVTRIKREARQLAEAKERQANAVPAPTGRVAVSGTVANTWTRDSDYGIQTKMRVETTEGWVSIGTVPSALLAEVSDHKDLRGAVVSFTATFRPTDDDVTVAWASRPSKAKLES